MKPIAHRRAMAGIAVCGAKERDGAKVVAWLRYVTCPACWRITDVRRARARLSVEPGAGGE